MLVPAAAGDRQEGQPSTGRMTAILAISTFAAVLCAWVLLSLAMPWREAVSGTVDAWRYAMNGEVRALEFYRWRMGLDAPMANVVKMMSVLAVYVTILLPPAVVAWTMRKRGTTEYAVSSAVFTILAAVLFLALDAQDWLEAARPLPLFMLASAVGWGIAAWRADTDVTARRDALLRMAVSAFAFTLLLKMLLNARVSHYGFVLAMPATLVVVVAIMEWIPQALARRGGSAMVYRAAALAVISLAAIGYVQHTRLHLGSRQAVMGEGSDSFRVGARGLRVRQAMEEAASLIGPDQTMAVLPEGVMLNYLLRRVNPTPYINLMPPECVLFGEGRMLDAFQGDPPDLIVYVAKNTAEYGMGQFGSGYSTRLWTWISERYRPAREFEPPGQRIWLLVPKGSGPNGGGVDPDQRLAR